MNDICPLCGGTLGKLTTISSAIEYSYRTEENCWLYGCKCCHAVFWGTETDLIPPPKT
jgi:hypothetical protein